MHNFERVLIPLLDKLLGKQGMAHDMTTSQGMYRVNYYWMKYRNMLDTLTVDAMRGEVSSYLQAPPAQKNLIGAIARTRWVSAERTSDNLMRALDIPATPIFIKKISDYFGGLDSAEWEKGSQYCTCVSSSNLSHIMLAFWWIANHTPGGKKGEGLVGCCDGTGFSTTFLPPVVPCSRLFMWLRVLLTSHSLLAYLTTLACRVLHLCKLIPSLLVVSPNYLPALF